MSFSLNIFVPPDEPVVSSSVENTDKKRDEKRSVQPPNSSRTNEKQSSKRIRTEANIEDVVPSSSNSTEASSKMNENQKKDVGKEYVKNEVDNGEKLFSRKNPEHRPRTKAPYSIIRQIEKAPTEEKPSEPSTHLFEEEKTFAALGLYPELAAHVSKPTEEKGMGLQTPTRVQSYAIPPLLNGRDALVKSETGSGKTLAFVLPMLHSLLTVESSSSSQRVAREDGTYALILSPTRELCLQIYDVLLASSKPFHWIISTAIVGGEKKKSEKARLRKGVNIIVATPGRFADHLRTTFSLNDSLKANPLKWLVLDEADRLLDTGFEKQVQEILNALKRLREEGGHGEAGKTQTILLSATITGGVEKLAGLCLRDPVHVDGGVRIKPVEPPPPEGTEPKIITVEHQDESSAFTTPKQLVQHYMLVESGDRLVALAAFLRRHIRRTGNTCKTLVFVASRACAEFFHAILSSVVWPPKTTTTDAESKKKKKGKSKSVKQEEEGENKEGEEDAPNLTEGLGTKWFVLHGSVDQKERKKTLKDFSSVRGGILICTDVAARGLDLPQVDLIVQYDPPSEVSEYVHRVGRTARSGRRGAAVIFLREAEVQYLEALKGHGIQPSPVKITYESLVPPHPIDEKTGKVLRNVQSEFSDPENCKQMLQKAFEEKVVNDEKIHALARSGYMSWVGAYSVHSAETKHIFVTRDLHFGHVARSFALKDPPTKIKQHHEEDSNKKNRHHKGNQSIETHASKQVQREIRLEEKQTKLKRIKKFDTKSEFEA